MIATSTDTSARLRTRAFRVLVGMLPDYWAIQLAFRWELGRFPNIKRPTSFNEKINWRKLYQRDPRFVVFADKIAVKTEVARLTGGEHIVPTMWQGRSPEDIPFEKLKTPYVIKTNHSSGHVIFVRDAEALNRQAVIASLRKQLAYPHGRWTTEWAYRNISRKILIEPMLTLSDGKVPEDYKFFVYHGRTHFVQVDIDRFEGHKSSYFDRDWQRLPMAMVFPTSGEAVPRPANFDTMLQLAERIGAPFDFVRVDLYQVPAGVYFGEATFYPDAGYAKMYPTTWDYVFGEPWKIDEGYPANTTAGMSRSRNALA